MALQERFAFRQGLSLGVQARAISGITTITLDGVLLSQTNTMPSRIGQVLLTIDGDSYQIDLEFIDEMLEAKDFLGIPKKRTQGEPEV